MNNRNCKKCVYLVQSNDFCLMLHSVVEMIESEKCIWYDEKISKNKKYKERRKRDNEDV